MFEAAIIITLRVLAGFVVRKMATYRRTRLPLFNGVLTGFFPVAGVLWTVLHRYKTGSVDDIHGKRSNGRAAEREYFRNLWSKSFGQISRGGTGALVAFLLIPVTIPLAVVLPKVSLTGRRERLDRDVTADISATVQGEVQQRSDIALQKDGRQTSQRQKLSESQMPKEGKGVAEVREEGAAVAPSIDEVAAANNSVSSAGDDAVVSESASLAPVERLNGYYEPDMYNPDRGVYVFYVGVDRQVETSRLLKTLGVPYQVRLDFREKEYAGHAYSRVATGDSFNVIDDRYRIKPIEVELDRMSGTARLVEAEVPKNFIEGALRAADDLERDFARHLGHHHRKGTGYAFDSAYTVHRDNRKVYLEKDGEVVAALCFDPKTFSKVEVYDEGACAKLGISCAMNDKSFLEKARDIVLSPTNVFSAQKDMNYNRVEDVRSQSQSRRIGNMFNTFFNGA